MWFRSSINSILDNLKAFFNINQQKVWTDTVDVGKNARKYLCCCVSHFMCDFSDADFSEASIIPKSVSLSLSLSVSTSTVKLSVSMSSSQILYSAGENMFSRYASCNSVTGSVFWLSPSNCMLPYHMKAHQWNGTGHNHLEHRLYQNFH